MIATRCHLAEIALLLDLCELPTDDLPEQNMDLFRVESADGIVIAAAGLERCGDAALLRSVATSPEQRGKGLARQLVLELEQLALSLGIAELYLLTETASRFFASLGYESRSRDEVPEAIRLSKQFAQICPQSATVMSKSL